MDEEVTEIRTSINDIHLTNKFLLKRLNKIIDDGDHQCTCHRKSESFEIEIRQLQTHMKSLEDKVNTRDDENRINKDMKTIMERLDVIESDFKLLESDDTVRRQSYTDSDATPRRNASNTQNDLGACYTENLEYQDEDNSQVLPRQTNTASENTSQGTQSSDKSNETKSKVSKFKLGSPTENVQSKFKNIEKTSEDSSKQSAGSRIKSKTKSNSSIRKPNFMTPKQSVELIKQDTKLLPNGEFHWRTLAQSELDAYLTRYRFLKDVHSVICLDISESMAHSDAWTEARTFITDYLTGVEEMSKAHPTDMKKEYVALVTFGHQTKIQVGYTDNFMDIEKELDKTKLGGPTQMYGGILMALAAAWCSTHQIEQLGNGSNIFTKIILVSDGRPTEDDLITGPDIADSSKVDGTKAKILQEMERFRKNHKDLFFVPVGNSDQDFHKTMAEFSGGFVLDYRQGKRFSRRHYLTTRLLDPLGLFAGIATIGSDFDLSYEDKEDLKSIQASAKRHNDESASTGNTPEGDVYNETKSKTLPPIGSRVRRGPDWHYTLQDSNGPGTVIGQDDDDHHVWVEWDANAHQNVYSYGPHGYDVLIIDETRKLTPGEKIAVGCQVTPGKDWKITDCNVNLGVVIKVNRSEKKATVRWNNGKRDSYLYDEIQEIRVKTDDDTRKVLSGSSTTPVGSATTTQLYELENPQAITIEEFAATKERKKNKNSD